MKKKSIKVPDYILKFCESNIWSSEGWFGSLQMRAQAPGRSHRRQRDGSMARLYPRNRACDQAHWHLCSDISPAHMTIKATRCKYNPKNTSCSSSSNIGRLQKICTNKRQAKYSIIKAMQESLEPHGSGSLHSTGTQPPIGYPCMTSRPDSHRNTIAFWVLFGCPIQNFGSKNLTF